jgi:[acyl-carrier-protein] S-malonyltransferase
LGEYSALVSAGSVTLEDALRVVRARGHAMQAAVRPGEGGMAAVMGASSEQVEALCLDAAEGDVLAPANYNAPGQTVIAGSSAAVGRAIELAKQQKLRAVSLKVSAPFHCSLMAPAADPVARSLAEVRLVNPSFPVIANVDAKPNSSGDRVADLLVRQVDSAVQWEASIRYLADAGVTKALEIGPGRVLAGLVKRIDKRLQVFSVSDPDSIDKSKEFFEG